MLPVRCLALLLFAMSSAVVCASEWLGYGGPGGTRIYADATPPLKFGKEALRWSVTLPSWGHGSPIIVGDKVFLMLEMLEGEVHFPSLLCLSLHDGKELWRKELDQTVAMGAAGKDARDAWVAAMLDMGKRRSLMQERPGGETEAAKAWEAKIAAAGYRYNARWKRLLPLDDKTFGTLMKRAAKGGFTLETWRQSLGSGTTTSCVGQGYATPVSDGRLVIVHTAWGGIFAFDLDGQQIWAQTLLGNAGEYCRNGRSPIIHGNLVFSDITNTARCYEKETGKLLWSDKDMHAHTIVTPAVIQVGGKEIVYAAGNNAYELASGKRLPVTGWSDYGMQTLVKHDEPDVVFFCGSGEHCGWTKKGKADIKPPAAVRFTYQGDGLQAKVLWHGGILEGDAKGILGGNSPWMLYDQGKFFHRSGAILDALTGKVLAGNFKRGTAGKAVPATSHLLTLAGGHVWGMRSGYNKKTKQGDLTFEIFDTDGKKLASNSIPWTQGKFSYGNTYTFAKDLIVARGVNHLLCFGAK